MGYWPKRMKRRRGSFVHVLDCKLVLLRCEGYRSTSLLRRTQYYLTHPSLGSVKRGAGIPFGTQVHGGSAGSATIKGAIMMGILYDR